MTEIALPEEIKKLAEECNPDHVKVVQAILSGEYSSNTAAYRSVYKDASEESAKASVSRLLTIDNVKALHCALRELQLLEGALTRAEAISILSDMARTSMGDVADFRNVEYEVDDEKIERAVWYFKNSGELSESALRSIHELGMTKEGLKLKLHDQKAAIKQLAEMMGWNKPQKLAVVGSLVATNSEMTLEEASRVFEDNLKSFDAHE